MKMVFCNGAFIEPTELADGSWGWVVVSFEEDCYRDGGELVEVVEVSQTEEELERKKR